MARKYPQAKFLGVDIQETNHDPESVISVIYEPASTLIRVAFHQIACKMFKCLPKM